MDGEIDTTTKSRWLSLYEILDINAHSGECQYDMPVWYVGIKNYTRRGLATSTCKISIWFRASPDHKQSFRNI